MIESFENIESLPKEAEEGYTVFVESTQEIMVFHEGEWVKMPESVSAADGKLQMSLYEINRQVVAQLPAFEDSQWEGAEKVLNDWTAEFQNEYFLLYGREVNYFTLYKREPECNDSLFSVIKECLDNIGPTRAFDITEDKTAAEIWVECEGKMTCLYLFNYDDGVVAFG